MSTVPGSRVVLSDFDLNSGMLRFMLKLRNEFCVLDAVEHASDMDENLWPQLVSKIVGLDVLHAGRVNPNLRIESGQVRSLVQFMRRNYTTLCFDLSGNLERYSLELMQESRRVLLVCTPEIPSLHLAREKMAFLRNLDLDGRVSVILNRVNKKPLFTKDQVEDVLGLPVLQIFGNDYHAVNRAMADGKIIDPNSDLGKQFAAFARQLLEKKQVAPKEQKRKFLEFFSVKDRDTPVPQK
jgi:Flp pilus assembly CpaE family ATPase